VIFADSMYCSFISFLKPSVYLSLHIFYRNMLSIPEYL
jgi:hypothetical protein